MKKLYEKEWLGISFESIAECSSKTVAGSFFYNKFYKKFFEQYGNWNDLDAVWREQKKKLAEFILSRLPARGKILSVGCGLGITEKSLLDMGVSDLEILDFSGEALCWARPLFPGDRVHVGKLPECVGASNKYSFIYISIVDYGFDDDEWVNHLRAVREHLLENGRCLVVSSTFREPFFCWEEIILNVKSGIKWLLSVFKIRSLGQFWGWRRSRKEFRISMAVAGFERIKEGFIESKIFSSKVYWIEGGR